jgi:hypothetical protein
LVLLYREPARAWTEALPIGNGRLGGMVFGGTASERIALNEDTVWAGERRDRTIPQALANLPAVRAVRLTCDRPGRISFSATLGRERDGRVLAVLAIRRPTGEPLPHLPAP